MSVLSIYERDYIGVGWDYCIPEWRRLVNEVRIGYEDWDSREDTFVLINQELSKYHGRLACLDYTVKEIIFASEAHRNWFLLRFL